MTLPGLIFGISLARWEVCGLASGGHAVAVAGARYYASYISVSVPKFGLWGFGPRNRWRSSIS
jgi:hypothetical protein